MAEPITNVLGVVGMKTRGAYNSETSYEKLNVVTYQGSSYCSKMTTQGNLPTNETYWDLIAEKGDKGDTGDDGYTPVKGTDYFTAEDIADLEDTLSDDVTSEVSDQLDNLASATPLVASSVAGMTDTTRVYVNTTDGHWYWYNGTSWQDGGTYQATQIANKTIIESMFKSTKRVSRNLLDRQVYYNGYISGSTGEIHKNATSETGLNIYTDFIEIDEHDIQRIGCTTQYNLNFYDSSKIWLSGTAVKSANTTADIPSNTKYIRVSLKLADLGSSYVMQYTGDVRLMQTDNFSYLIDEVVTEKDLLFNNNNKLPLSNIDGYKSLNGNLFNPFDLIDGALNSDGGLQKSATLFTTPKLTKNFITITPETSYYLGKNIDVSISYFNSNKEFISKFDRTAGSSTTLITTPANATYCKIGCDDEDRYLVYFIQGNSPKYTESIGYLQGISTKRIFPTTSNSAMTKKEYDNEDLLLSANISSKVYVDDDTLIVDNSDGVIGNRFSRYYLKRYGKCIEIEYDIKIERNDGTSENNGAGNGLNFRYEGSELTFTPAAETRYSRCFKVDSNFRHIKVRYLIPKKCDIIDIPFFANVGVKAYIKNISIKFVEHATNYNNPNLTFVGHQGMPRLAPENTIPCFEYAIAGGMDSCVINVNYTSDGEIVCLHDDTIDRTSNGSGNIHTMTYADASQYDYGSWFGSEFTGTKLPKLSEVLELFSKSGIKPTIRWNNGITGTNKTKLFNLIKRYGLTNNTRIIGFDIDTIESLYEEYPEFKYGYCGYATVNDALCERIKALGKDPLIDRETFTETDIIKAKEYNLKVSAWNVNAINTLRTYVGYGVDEIKTDWFAYNNCIYEIR